MPGIWHIINGTNNVAAILPNTTVMRKKNSDVLVIKFMNIIVK